MRRSILIAALLCSAFCACKAKGNNDVVLAKVNGEPIYRNELALALKFELTKYGPKTAEDPKRVEDLKKTLFDDLVKDRILYSAAQAAGISMTENELAEEYVRYKSQYTEAAFQKMLSIKGISYDEWKADKKREAFIDKLIKKEVLPGIGVTDNDIKKYYNRNKKKFTHGDEVHARQILVEDPALAEQLRTRAENGENFAALAQEFSIAPEGRRGGDLGWFPRGVMPKEFDEACFPLPTGEISPIVKTEFGYHIFKVLERRSQESAKLEDVKEKIVVLLQQTKMDEAFGKWYEPLKAKAKITVNEDVLKSIEAPKEIK